MMSSTEQKKRNLKEKVYHEFVAYWINVCYLTLVFAAFTIYRRLILAAHDVTYTNYGFAVIEALILAKVIMIGDVFRLGRGLEQKPLIFPTLSKTVVFTLFVAFLPFFGVKELGRVLEQDKIQALFFKKRDD